MEEEHFNYLVGVNHIPQGQVGKNALRFGNQVQDLEELDNILDQQFNREGLQQFCANPNNSNLSVTVSVLAWGGMRFGHARNLFNNWRILNEIVTQLRTGQINNRLQAFNILQDARANGHLSGLGIAYFTKLICFLNPNLNGFILDQWTGKSINFLWGDPLVDISVPGWVTDNNDGQTYEHFCSRIEELAQALDCTPKLAEERIFSVGGKNAGQWRQYLKNNYPRQWV